jgi:transcriptional regulator with XRE-family HTH domain
MPNNIKKLREEKKYTQEELGKIIGASTRMISFYEKDERPFSLRIAEQLADIFECSIDYLLCRTNIRSNNIDISNAYIGVLEECDKNKIPPKQLLKAIEFIRTLDD